MPVLMQSLGDFFKLTIEAFSLSSIFPSIIFVMLLRQCIFPLFQDGPALLLGASGDETLSFFLTAIFVALVAYLLDAANMQIIRLFEGYWFQDQFPFNLVQRLNQNYVSTTVGAIRQLEELIEALDKQGEQEDEPDLQLCALYLARYKTRLVKTIDRKYPEDPDRVLASPFGNVICAAEQYPEKVFGMDSIVLWPFLVPTLTDKSYAPYVVRSKATVDFLVNLTTVIGLFGLILGFSEIAVNGYTPALAPKLLAVFVSCTITFLLSVQGAAGWGSTIRTAFVLFRHDLRQSLGLRCPKSYKDERRLWKEASHFFRAQRTEVEQQRWGSHIYDRSSYCVPGAKEANRDEKEKSKFS